MICESELCIYQENDKCILPDEVRLNRQGVCCYFCPIDLDKARLQQEKRALLADYETEAFMKDYDAKHESIH